MARSRRNAYRSSLLPTLFIGGTAIGMLGLAGLFVAWSMGMFESKRELEIDRTGQLAFPALAQPVPAFEAISREHLINPRTGQLNVVWLPEKTAEVASRNLGDIVGRVLGRDKGAGMVLTEHDFLPKGTSPGISAGVPPGKFAVTIAAKEIPGLEQLRHGDRFDLMIALKPSDVEKHELIGNSEPAAVFGGIKPPSLRVGMLSRQHGVKRLVAGGQLITLLQGKQQSTKGSSGLTVKPSSRQATALTTTYAEIAIDEEEVGPLTEAISLHTPMTCVVRSGRPDSEIEASFSREGLVAVITTATDVDAYSELTDETLIDNATGQLHYYYFPPDRVPEHWLTDPTAVYGRVVSRSLRRGSPITESDLLPVGTKQGISAGVPEGMVAMAIKTNQLSGFDDLMQGDRFAIHANIPDVAVRPMDSSWITLQGGSLAPETERFERMLSSGIREVVPEAVLLRRSTDDMATIAVPDDRIAEVAQLIRDDAEMFVVARSATEKDKLPSQLRKSKLKSVSPDDFVEIGYQTDKPEPARTPFATVANTVGESAETLVSQIEAATDEKPVEVPVLTRSVKAFEPLSIDDFVDPATGQIRYVYFPIGKMRDDWQTDVSQLIDRVALRDLKAGRTVSMNDLAPPGTPAGPSAGVPAGMEGILVDSNQIVDLDLLRPGSTFDIVSGRVLEAAQLGDQVRRTLSSSDAIAEADKLPGFGAPLSQSIVTGAILLSEFGASDRTRQDVLTRRTTTRTTTAGGIEEVQTAEEPDVRTTTQTVQRFAIAVPERIARNLISFINRGVPLRVVLSSVQPDADQAGVDKASSRGNGDMPDDDLVRTFVREHFIGSEKPVTEVFVSDRVYSMPAESPSAMRAVPRD
ncbi:hypothetical protein [Rhodopirellula sp. MGV]|uniref:hypothetical protein n=1 Tax=Rhodopirellula sp. MGV TaxID=2023130 RepID=UPI0013042AB8|nr:hypothetical protein [Rhodopirellula sp. MGV]